MPDKPAGSETGLVASANPLSNGSVMISQAVRRLIEDIVSGRGRATDFADDDRLAEIGVSSVDMVALVLALEARFDIEIPRRDMTAAQFTSAATVAALMTRLVQTAGLPVGGAAQAWAGIGSGSLAAD